MKPTLILTRGISGSGKSTLAKKLVKIYENLAHVETDMFWMEKGKYVFDATRLGEAHKWCFDKTVGLLKKGKNVIVSNTFCNPNDFLQYGYLSSIADIVIIELDTEYENIHDVTEDILNRQKENLLKPICPFFSELVKIYLKNSSIDYITQNLKDLNLRITNEAILEDYKIRSENLASNESVALHIHEICRMRGIKVHDKFLKDTSLFHHIVRFGFYSVNKEGVIGIYNSMDESQYIACCTIVSDYRENIGRNVDEVPHEFINSLQHLKLSLLLNRNPESYVILKTVAIDNLFAKDISVVSYY